MRHLTLALGALLLAQPAMAAPKWDVNGDGKMNRDEFVAISSARMIERADADKNGNISLQEWNARPAALKAKEAGKDPEKVFARLDNNKDGFVQAVDFTPKLEKRFDRLDADKDGVLTKAERQAGRKTMQNKD